MSAAENGQAPATENGQIPAALKASAKAPPEEKRDATDYKAEAQFWQLKYFELMIHSNQIITALSRPMLTEQVVAQLQTAAQTARQ